MGVFTFSSIVNRGNCFANAGKHQSTKQRGQFRLEGPRRSTSFFFFHSYNMYEFRNYNVSIG